MGVSREKESLLRVRTDRELGVNWEFASKNQGFIHRKTR